ncbi:Ribosomal protein L34Ae [Heracleum sosnowskyi]|uniref:Ribosomal protein L34Ae n=1 Tax=Heracleum sosnowskyi TaxID=360622 RepID=A0AAD8GNQ4_9APIA|nr:Ribosomal protein L34Ae [Heracleum sosnowskyi]
MRFSFQRLFNNFWFVVSTYMLPLFGVMTTYFFRLHMKNDSVKYSSSTLGETNEKIVSGNVNEMHEKESNGDVLSTGFLEKETCEFSFKFKFPTYEEFITSKRGSGESVSSVPKSYTQFNIQEPETVIFGVEEVKTEPNDEEEYLSDKHLSVAPLEKLKNTKVGTISGVDREEINEKNETAVFRRSKGDDFDVENYLQVSDGIEYSSMDSDFKWIGTDGFLSEKDFGETIFDLDYLIDVDEKAGSGDELSDLDESLTSYGFDGEDSDIMKELGKLEEDRMDSTESDLDESQECYDFQGEDSDIMEELKKLEDHMNSSEKNTSNFLSPKHLDEVSNSSNQVANDKFINTATNSELRISAVETEDVNKLEMLWEHQDLVEQLKMELKKARASGLPTILEDSESPKIMEDLKPWKIDEKLQHQNPMGELHKFYKSYREKMRKLDVLTYQKIYAVGFLHLKEPGHSSSAKKISIPDIASFLSENLDYDEANKHETNPMKKFINELQTELELVYVGQMCLSWEFLHWQYGMALDLWDSDPRGIHRYNEVAGEFQQFQVHVQRFIEDEPFQGPRVQNYIKHRCVFRDFLQIPVIREDISNDGKKGKGTQRSDYTITSDLLVEILEESIRLFWRFVRADKQCNHANVRRRKEILVDPQEKAASEILVELQKDLQKKAKKLKDQLRSSHCILKKFRKCQEDDSSSSSSNQVLFFFSQVDLKLVSRVLSMSKLNTEQLAWCRSKLSSISFINRKVHVEPSFCLFPC